MQQSPTTKRAVMATQKLCVSMMMVYTVVCTMADKKKIFFLPYRSDSRGMKVSDMHQPAKTEEPSRPI